jgi:micrococcal nuclease
VRGTGRGVWALVAAILLTGCGLLAPEGGSVTTSYSAGPDEPAPAARPDPVLAPPPDGTWRGEVTHISDGDTLWVRVTGRDGVGPPEGEEVKLRLLRIDTPELARGGDPAECLAEAARDHLRALLPEGTVVLAAYDVEVQDRYGRDLVHLWTADGRWVNGAMLLDGFARVVTFPPNEAYTDEALAAERSAREAGRGLWGDTC